MSRSRVGQQVKNGASFPAEKYVTSFYLFIDKVEGSLVFVFSYLSYGYKIRRCWIFDDTAGSDPGSSLRAKECKVGCPLLHRWLNPKRRHCHWGTLGDRNAIGIELGHGNKK